MASEAEESTPAAVDPGESNSGQDKITKTVIFENLNVFYLTIGVWVISLIVFFFIWKLIGWKSKIYTLDDQNGKSDSKPYKYLFRIRSGNCTVNFDNETAKIIIYFLDRTKGRIKELVLPPKWIFNTSYSEPDLSHKDSRTCQFYWPQEQPLSQFFYIQLSHTCRIPNSAITIYDIDIRERYTSTMAHINVNHPIKSLDKGLDKEQTYPVALVDDPLRDDARPKAIDGKSFIVFMFLCINLVLTISLYIPNNPMETDDTTKGIVNGTAALAISFISTLVTMFIYASFRRRLPAYTGQEFSYFTGLSLINVTYFALTCGLMGAFDASRYNTVHTNNWATGVGVAFAILFIFLAPTLLYFVNHISRDYGVSSKDSETKPRGNGASDRHDDLPPLPKSPSQFSIQSTGSNYYDQLMGSGNIPKVKSISQYGALLAQQELPK